MFLNSILSIVNSVNILFSLFHLSPFPSFSIPGVFFSFCGCFFNVSISSVHFCKKNYVAFFLSGTHNEHILNVQ